jgi:glycosyltransferase involved in cell wall biosynthesis
VTTKKVSIIIPNYNYGRFLPQAIESVLDQSYENIELIVVNNGSTDDSLKVLGSYAKFIKVIDQPNLGQSGARNSGLTNCSGSLIGFLDADDYWELDKVEKQISLVRGDTELIYCGIRRFSEGKGASSDELLPSFRGECKSIFLTHPGVSVVLSGESTALFTRDLLQKVGGFDLKLNSAAGWDFFRRCSAHTKFDYIDQALVNYRIHESNMSSSVKNNIQDLKAAYRKFYTDVNWNLDRKLTKSINRKLEITFFKTYIKNFKIQSAFFSIWKLIFRIDSSR